MLIERIAGEQAAIVYNYRRSTVELAVLPVDVAGDPIQTQLLVVAEPGDTLLVTTTCYTSYELVRGAFDVKE